MKSKAKVVVIGGGAVGVSMLYHLAKKGWSDVVLVERKELTSGSTWHAAGLLPLFNMSYSVGQLHKYAVNLYKTLEKETGKSVGFSVVSNIRLAQTKDRMDEYHQYAGVAKTIGPQLGVNLVFGVQIFLDNGIGSDLEAGRLHISHGVSIRICVVSTRDQDGLGHNSLGLVDIPGLHGIGDRVMLPSRSELCEAPVDN